MPHELQKLKGEKVQAFGAMISGIIWVDKRYLWLVDGIQGKHQPIISNACPPKRSQKSLRQRPLPILLKEQVENTHARI